MVTIGKVLLIALMLNFAVVESSMAFGIPGLGGAPAGGEKKEGGFDIDKTTTQFKESLWGATELSGKAVKDLYEAIGKKEEAVKLEQLLKELKNAKDKDDNDAFKKISEQINNAQKSLAETDLEKDAKSAEGKKYVGAASLKTAVAVYLDKIAIDNAKLLIEKLPDEISSNPMKAAKLNSVLSMAKFAADKVPDNLSNLGKVVSNITKYAKTNGIPSPSKDEKQKALKDAAPSIDPKDLA